MINKYDLSVCTNDKGEFMIWGKLRCNMLSEVWSYWKPTIIEALIDFEKELKKSENRKATVNISGKEKQGMSTMGINLEECIKPREEKE